ncbi:hypothetical protein EXIGLDRAFT_843286 [Exidia glandulosa HHB12029]|uniref:F-box domain-containing protein n=1 Tax=Exidia glandulosa HHB12029 TaxID=1314781 RepID=A0A165CS88_EXIGL|nr:hypothetical protein EXIGLDRAFT_843286 [Exidia glandulosa HHB12029]
MSSSRPSSGSILRRDRGEQLAPETWFNILTSSPFSLAELLRFAQLSKRCRNAARDCPQYWRDLTYDPVSANSDLAAQNSFLSRLYSKRDSSGLNVTIHLDASRFERQPLPQHISRFIYAAFAPVHLSRMVSIDLTVHSHMCRPLFAALNHPAPLLTTFTLGVLGRPAYIPIDVFAGQPAAFACVETLHYQNDVFSQLCRALSLCPNIREFGFRSPTGNDTEFDDALIATAKLHASQLHKFEMFTFEESTDSNTYAWLPLERIADVSIVSLPDPGLDVADYLAKHLPADGPLTAEWASSFTYYPSLAVRIRGDGGIVRTVGGDEDSKRGPWGWYPNSPIPRLLQLVSKRLTRIHMCEMPSCGVWDCFCDVGEFPALETLVVRLDVSLFYASDGSLAPALEDSLFRTFEGVLQCPALRILVIDNPDARLTLSSRTVRDFVCTRLNYDRSRPIALVLAHHAAGVPISCWEFEDGDVRRVIRTPKALPLLDDEGGLWDFVESLVG